MKRKIPGEMTEDYTNAGKPPATCCLLLAREGSTQWVLVSRIDCHKKTSFITEGSQDNLCGLYLRKSIYALDNNESKTIYYIDGNIER